MQDKLKSKREHRPCFDLLFSSPKSVSLRGKMSSDRLLQLLGAHAAKEIRREPVPALSKYNELERDGKE
jgi:hypothetical protein